MFFIFFAFGKFWIYLLNKKKLIFQQMLSCLYLTFHNSLNNVINNVLTPFTFLKKTFSLNNIENLILYRLSRVGMHFAECNSLKLFRQWTNRMTFKAVTHHDIRARTRLLYQSQSSSLHFHPDLECLIAPAYDPVLYFLTSFYCLQQARLRFFFFIFCTLSNYSTATAWIHLLSNRLLNNINERYNKKCLWEKLIDEIIICRPLILKTHPYHTTQRRVFPLSDHYFISMKFN